MRLHKIYFKTQFDFPTYILIKIFSSLNILNSTFSIPMNKSIPDLFVPQSLAALLGLSRWWITGRHPPITRLTSSSSTTICSPGAFIIPFAGTHFHLSKQGPVSLSNGTTPFHSNLVDLVKTVWILSTQPIPLPFAVRTPYPALQSLHVQEVPYRMV